MRLASAESRRTRWRSSAHASHARVPPHSSLDRLLLGSLAVAEEQILRLPARVQSAGRGARDRHAIFAPGRPVLAGDTPATIDVASAAGSAAGATAVRVARRFRGAAATPQT